MKKLYLSTAAMILIIFASAFIFSASQKTTKYTLAAPYTIDQAKENHDVYLVKGPDLKDNRNLKIEYYNIEKLDKFIEKSLMGEKGRIRVIKFANGYEDYALKWMYDIEYDGANYKLNICAKDSVVNNKYRVIFTSQYDTLKKTGDKNYKFFNGQEPGEDLL